MTFGRIYPGSKMPPSRAGETPPLRSRGFLDAFPLDEYAGLCWI